jgi:ferredoxin
VKTITDKKQIEEIKEYLDGCSRVYLVGCGNCATMCHTGGKTEVLAMKAELEAAGKEVSGWMVMPTACDELTGDALGEEAAAVKAADCLLVLTCAFGVQTVASYVDKPVYPALNTLFLGRETETGHFQEICLQCGQCLLGRYAAVCPITQCAKGLLSGPCGGSKDGRCEQQSVRDCAWVLIYERLKKTGQLDKLMAPAPPRDYSKTKRPRAYEAGESARGSAEG